MAMTPSSKAYGDDEVRYLGVKRRPWDWERCAADIRRLETFNTAEEAASAHNLAVIRFQKIKAKTNFPIPVVSPSWGPIPGGVGRGRVIPVSLCNGGLHCHPALPAAARGSAIVKGYVKIAPAPPKVLDLFPGARPEATGVLAGKTRQAPRGRGSRKTGPSATVVEPPKTAPVSRGFELDLDLNFPPAEDRSLNLRLGLV